MKRSLSLLVCALPLAAVAQSAQKIRILDSETHAPLPNIYCTILKDNDHRIDIDHTDSSGTVVPDYHNPDPNNSYQADIWGTGYLPLRQTIDPFAAEVVIEIARDKNALVKQPGLTYTGCSTISFGDYEPLEPQALSDLPQNIRKKLEKHLVKRLGKEFYGRLSLSGGQLVNLDRLYKVEPKARDYQWTPYSYYLCFSFSDPARGIGLYTAQIVLDSNGKVIEEIAIPAIAAHPEKAVLLSKDAARTIAIANGSSEEAAITLGYDRKADAVIWMFTESVFSPNHTFSGSTLVIDAHSGAVIGKYGSGGIWD